MNKEVMFSSEKDDWETPQEFFEKLNKEFGFTLDVCANNTNTKCEKWFGYAYVRNEGNAVFTDGLTQSWQGEVCWMNPPYGKEIGKWVKKAYEESQKGCTVVCLLPARTDTRWFHEYILGKAEIRFIKGRLKFGGSKNSAPFPSMIVIFHRYI